MLDGGQLHLLRDVLAGSAEVLGFLPTVLCGMLDPSHTVQGFLSFDLGGLTLNIRRHALTLLADTMEK